MNDMTAPKYLRSAFLDGKAKGLLIDGKWIPAASGKTFKSTNPATGEELAQIAEASASDVDLAVAAARRAFEGPWRKFKPFERQALLLKLADLVDRNFEELAMIDTLDMGGPITRTMAAKRRAVGLLRFYAGLATSIHGQTIASTRSPSPVPPKPARRSFAPRPGTSSGCRSSWAASRPTSFSQMRTWTRPCQAPPWPCSRTRDRSAAREPACSSKRRSTTNSCTASPNTARR